jgi:hypothetical protein
VTWLQGLNNLSVLRFAGFDHPHKCNNSTAHSHCLWPVKNINSRMTHATAPQSVLTFKINQITFLKNVQHVFHICFQIFTCSFISLFIRFQ